jgi:hypothetical protein
MLDTAPIGIVGDGRAARHFVHYVNLLDLSFRTRSRRERAALRGDPFHAVHGVREGI